MTAAKSQQDKREGTKKFDGLFACFLIENFFASELLPTETYEVKRANSSQERVVAVEIKGL